VESSASVGAVDAVSSSAGSHGMFLSAGPLLAVSVKNRSSGREKNRSPEEKSQNKRRDMFCKLWINFLFRNSVTS